MESHFDPHFEVSASSRPSPTPVQVSSKSQMYLGRTERNHSLLDPLSTSEAQGRSSFSSIKENVTSGLAQSFTNSKTSSLVQFSKWEQAVAQFPDHVGMAVDGSKSLRRSSSCRDRAKMRALVPSFIRTHHQSERMPPGAINEGPVRSKTLSFDNLKDGWNSFKKLSLSAAKRNDAHVAGESRLEKLPTEILTQIISHLALDIPPVNYAPRNSDLVSLTLTSSKLHRVTLPVLYMNVTIPHSPIYSKFLQKISASSSLARMVRRLDFSHFNPTMSGLSARERRATMNLTRESLLHGLEATANLREFLAQEHIDDDLSADVLRKLFTGLPQLQALDLCACSSATFRDSFVTFVSGPLPDVFHIARLSLHECTILPSLVYESILPRMPHLTHLDVSRTLMTDEALQSIPATARITHLNLSKCARLSGAAVTHFLRTHAAIIGDRTQRHPGLIYLDLRSDATTHSLLSPRHLSDLIPALPRTLRSLKLSGSDMSRAAGTDNAHITALLPLAPHLEELSLGRHVPLSAVNELFSGARAAGTCALRYLDISALGAAEGVSMGALLDTHRCPLLRPSSRPLEVLEISEALAETCRRRPVGSRHQGWRLMEAGRRCWLVRDLRAAAAGGGRDAWARIARDDGARAWKMGATYWGMRKIPVARMEVGGMYGLYMFKR